MTNKTQVKTIVTNNNTVWASVTGLALAGIAYEMGNIKPSLKRATICMVIYSVGVNMLTRGVGKSMGEEIKRLKELSTEGESK